MPKRRLHESPPPPYMSTGLVVVVTVLYVWTSIALAVEGKPGMSLCFFGYALANVGLILAMRST